MRRHALTEEQWRRLQKVLPEQKTGPESTLGDRLFIEAVLFRAKTGMPWRDLPERFGPWKSIYNRFNNWAKKGHWELIFKELQLEIDEVGSIVDGSVVRAHQDASGGKGGSDAMLWAVLEEVFQPSSTPSSTRKAARSTSRSRRGSGTK
jgi:transposase